MYARFFKRVLDIFLSFTALAVLLPLMLILTVVGAAVMGGNPFFTQLRPGKDEKVFRLIKFRTMTNKKGAGGELLPDEQRLVKYGKFLRSTSLDELPELINILKGDMSIVGPRPLLVKYLPLYNDEQRRRHDVRPGLTGYAQTHGRNLLTWEEKFEMDVYYVNNISFVGDMKIILRTVICALKRDGISGKSSVTMEEFHGTPLRERLDA